jgi:hypothetical protein
MPQNFGGETFLLFNQSIWAVLGKPLLCFDAAQALFSLNTKFDENLFNRYFLKVGIGFRCDGWGGSLDIANSFYYWVNLQVGVLSAFLDAELHSGIAPRGSAQQKIDYLSSGK